jgi:ribose 5-phosphate isomerase A
MAMPDLEKHFAARAAVGEIAPGMVIGIGTGTTVAQMIPILAARVREGLDVRAVATSLATEQAARAAGIAMIAFEDRASVDLTIDGVDEIDPSLRAIKGAGGALLREKIVAAASTRMVAIADSSKFSRAIGARPVPVEVLPFAREFVLGQLAELGARPVLRMTAGEWARSDQGNLLIDCTFPGLHGPELADPDLTAGQLSAIPGLLGHGLFLTEIDALYIAHGEDVARHERPPI